MDAACIDYKDTGYFSHTVTDYLDDVQTLRPFYNNRPDLNGFGELLKSKKVVANRHILVDVLKEQYGAEYENVADFERVSANISSLGLSNTYTITTGHQLNIFRGPLYFIYKIVTAIKLSQKLKQHKTDTNCVPF